MMQHIKLLRELKACASAIEYAQEYPNLADAWQNCHRGDWMLWLAAALDVDIRVLTLAKGHCANTVRPLMTSKRSRAAVDAAIAFGEGKISRTELDDAATRASAAYAYTAANATAYAYAPAAYAAAAYAAAAYAADAHADIDAEKDKNRKATADICRKYLTEGVFEKLKGA